MSNENKQTDNYIIDKIKSRETIKEFYIIFLILTVPNTFLRTFAKGSQSVT